MINRGASPLGLPYTRARSPLRRLAPFPWLASLRSLAAAAASPLGLPYTRARSPLRRRSATFIGFVLNSRAMTRLLLEVIATSIEDAVEAAKGGAHRLEIVRELARGGLTPSLDLVREIQREVPLPLRVMVRASDGFACRSDDERRELADQAAALNALRVDGIVAGWTRGERIDEDTLGRVLEAAPSLQVTFHRAFDALPDPDAALQALQRFARIDRVLTSAGAGAWTSRLQTLARYARSASPQIGILPGGEVDAEALRALASSDCVSEAHVGRAARVGHAVDGRVSADAVIALRRAAGWDN
jgi:copper homeostasis protein